MTLQGKLGVFAGAALLRLLLFVIFPALPDLLTGRVEISTPVTSFKRRKSPTATDSIAITNIKSSLAKM